MRISVQSSWKTFLSIISVLVILTLAAVTVHSSYAQNNQGDQGNAFAVKVLVLTTFDGEQQPWLDHETWPKTITVPGAHDVLHCQNNGICVTITGTGKSNSAQTLATLLGSSKLNFTNAKFVVAAIAGTRPTAGTEGFQGTLGFAGIANWIVDGDLGTHFDYRDVTPSDPAEVQQYAWWKLQDYENGQFHLNETLAAKAYDLTHSIALADSSDAQAARAHYPEQAGLHPFVARCDTVGADDFFSGTYDANTMDHIVKVRSNGAATKCTSEFEDPGFANALRLHGMLDRLIVVRTASDFETPAAGETTVELLNEGFPGYTIATENEYRVGSVIAHYFSTHSN